MKTRNKLPLSIYIHIPFCKRKCLYCDFLSAPACAQEREGYVKALLREISLMAKRCKDYEVISVFFGGGTPSLLGKSQIRRIMAAIRKGYTLMADAEITLECNPATATFDKLTAYRECGINRLSIGLQSANDKELRELGRVHTYCQFLQTYSDARMVGFDNINIDIMSALPGQTMDSYLETLYKVLALRPEHISAYSLIIEEGTPFYERYGEQTQEDFKDEKREIFEENSGCKSGEYIVKKNYPALPDEDTERAMYHKTNSLLQKAGYTRYEISNFARKSYECRHNITYWTGVDYIGLGVGAASYFQGTRYKNSCDVNKYQELLGTSFKEAEFFRSTDEDVLVALQEEVQQLSIEEKMEEFLFLGLRLKKGISIGAFQKKFGKNIDEVYGTVIDNFVGEGVLIRRNNRLYLSKKGTDVANYVMAGFLLT